MNLGTFWREIEGFCVPEKDVKDIEMAMQLIEWICYSPKTNFSDIDFSSFSVEQAKAAFEELFNYYADDSGGDEDENCGNLLVEINRIAHMRQSVQSLKAPRKRRFI